MNTFSQVILSGLLAIFGTCSGVLLAYKLNLHREKRNDIKQKADIFIKSLIKILTELEKTSYDIGATHTIINNNLTELTYKYTYLREYLKSPNKQILKKTWHKFVRTDPETIPAEYSESSTENIVLYHAQNRFEDKEQRTIAKNNIKILIKISKRQ